METRERPRNEMELTKDRREEIGRGRRRPRGAIVRARSDSERDFHSPRGDTLFFVPDGFDEPYAAFILIFFTARGKIVNNLKRFFFFFRSFARKS